MGEVDPELAELVALAREHVRWELELGARGLPDRVEEIRQRRAAAPERAAPASDPEIVPELSPSRSQEEAGGRGRAELESPPAPPPRPSPASGGGGAPAAADRGAPAASDRRARLSVVEAEVSTCTKCRLHAGRTRTVFARGNPDARLVFVGEGPGFNEDQQGLPFVGKAGQLLDRMIAAMGFSQDEVYICNVVKCRPPENRTPSPDEAAACMPYLRAQLEVIAPAVIVALGRCAAENLGVAQEGQRWRGVWGTFEGVRVMPTYHPAYLLRNPEHKRPVWQDLQEVVAALGRELPAGRR